MTDDALALARRWWEVYREVNSSSALSDEEADRRSEEVFPPLEEELKATRPTTREGVIAVLDVAYKCSEQGIHNVATPLIANARDALKGGAS